MTEPHHRKVSSFTSEQLLLSSQSGIIYKKSTPSVNQVGEISSKPERVSMSISTEERRKPSTMVSIG